MKTILVVDDEQNIRESIFDFLTEIGFNVLTANNGMEGLARARESHPELILCDIDMPLVNGYTMMVALQLDNKTKDIPIIVITGKQDKSEIGNVKLLGAEDCITKPFSLERLRSSIDLHIQGNFAR